MKPIVKIAVSLLITVVLFSVFTFLAFSGLFNYIESRFYDQRIKQTEIQDVKRYTETISAFHKANDARFESVLQNYAPALFSANLSREQIVGFQNLTDKLKSDFPGFLGVRFVDTRGFISYSDYSTDILSQTTTSRLYKRLSDVEPKLPESLLLKSAGTSVPFIDGSRNRIIYRYAVEDHGGQLLGTALFFVSTKSLGDYLIKNGVLDLANELQVVDRLGYLFNLNLSPQSATYTAILDHIVGLWSKHQGVADFERLAKSDFGTGFLLYTVHDPVVGYVGSVVSESQLSLTMPLKILLLVSFFVTVYLLVFLILSLRQDRIVILKDRIKRFQITFLREYVENKEEIDWQRWRSDLQGRKEELRGAIKKGLGKLKGEKTAEVDQLFEKSWSDIIDVIGKRVEAKTPARIEISNLEEIVKRIIAGGGLGDLATQTGERRLPPAVSAPEKVEMVPEAEPVEELAEAEEAEELAEAVEEAEPVEEVEELEEAEPVEELAEAEEVEELAEAVEEAEPVEEVEELEEAEPVEELVEAEEVEELAEAVEEAEPVEEVEELEEAEPVEELAEAEEVEELPEAVEAPAVSAVERRPAETGLAVSGVELEEVAPLDESALTEAGPPSPVRHVDESKEEERISIYIEPLPKDEFEDLEELEAASEKIAVPQSSEETLLSLERAPVSLFVNGVQSLFGSYRSFSDAPPTLIGSAESDTGGSGYGSGDIESGQGPRRDRSDRNRQKVPAAGAAVNSAEQEFEALIARLQEEGRIEIASGEQVAQQLSTDDEPVEFRDGVYQIREETVQESADAAAPENGLGDLLKSVVSDSDEGPLGIGDLIGDVASELAGGLDGDMVEEQQRETAEEEAVGKIISLQGIDFSAAIRARGNEFSADLDLLMRASRCVGALSAAFLTVSEHALTISVSIGVQDPKSARFRVPVDSTLFRGIFGKRLYLLARSAESGLEVLDSAIGPADRRLLAGSLYVPVLLGSDEAYLFLGLKDAEITIESCVSALTQMVEERLIATGMR